LALTSKQERAPDCEKPMVRWLSASGTGMGAALPVCCVVVVLKSQRSWHLSLLAYLKMAAACAWVGLLLTWLAQ
jgi:hypothetical protein